MTAFVSEILHRFHHTSKTVGEVHAQRPEQHEVQNMATGGVDALRVFHHDTDRFEHAVAHDEGKCVASVLYYYHHRSLCIIYHDRGILSTTNVGTSSCTPLL